MGYYRSVLSRQWVWPFAFPGGQSGHRSHLGNWVVLGFIGVWLADRLPSGLWVRSKSGVYLSVLLSRPLLSRLVNLADRRFVAFAVAVIRPAPSIHRHIRHHPLVPRRPLPPSVRPSIRPSPPSVCYPVVTLSTAVLLLTPYPYPCCPSGAVISAPTPGAVWYIYLSSCYLTELYKLRHHQTPPFAWLAACCSGCQTLLLLWLPRRRHAAAPTAAVCRVCQCI